MERLSVNLKDLESYKDLLDINEKIENLNIIHYGFKYNYDKKYLNDIIIDHIDKLEREFFSSNKLIAKEIVEMIPILNSKKAKEITPIFDYLDNDINKKILSYIYWKYKNENSNEKANIQNLKKLLGVKSAKEEYIIPAEYKVACSKCNGDGVIYIHDYDLTCMEYECFTCSHKEERESYNYKYGILLKCCCKNCMYIKEKLYYFMKNNLKNLINEIKCKFIDKYFKLGDIIVPSDKQMEDDFRLHSSTLTKDENEVLSFNPKTINEVLNVIKNIETRDSKYQRKNSALRKFLEHRIIYHTRHKINKNQINDILTEIVINNFLHFEIIIKILILTIRLNIQINYILI